MRLNKILTGGCCMKYVNVIWLVLLFALSASAGIVSNGASSEDTLAVPLMLTDSLGNPGSIPVDSFLITLFGPSGDSLMAIADIADGSLDIDSIQTAFGTIEYLFTSAVSDLVSSNRYGLYYLTFCGKSTTYGLSGCNTVPIQFASAPLSAIFAADTEILDTLKSHDDWVAKENTLSGLSIGSGLYSCLLTAVDSATGEPLHNITVAVRNLTQDALIAVGTTRNNGQVPFNLNSDSFTVIASARDYQFQAYDTLVITGSTVDTIFGNKLPLNKPISPSLCRVYGYLADITGAAERDITVTASLPGGVATTSGYIISPFTTMTTTDSSGYFVLDLIPSDSLQPDGQLYEITIFRSDGTILRQRISVPVQSEWELRW